MAKCRYNEQYVLPALPEWDENNYPYAIILTRANIAYDYWLICSSSPFAAATMDGNTIIAFDTDANLYWFTYSVSDAEDAWKNGRVYDPQEDENVLAYYFDPSKVSYVWTNTDIHDGDDNVVYAASDPVPIIETDYLMSWLTGYILGISGKPYPFATEHWETVFDGEITVVNTDDSRYQAAHIRTSQPIGLGDVVRITDNKNSWVLPVYKAKPSMSENVEYIFGNSELYGNLAEVVEYTDCDYCGCQYSSWNNVNYCYLYTRTPGTYTLKIERMVG